MVSLLGLLASALWYTGGFLGLATLLLLLLFVVDLYSYVPFARAGKRALRLGNVRYKVGVTVRRVRCLYE